MSNDGNFMEIQNRPGESQLPGAVQNQKPVILFITILFHLVLIFRTSFADLFQRKEIGYFILACLLLLLFSLFFFIEKTARQSHQELSFLKHVEFKSSLRLFIVFACLIFAFGIFIRVIAIRMVPLGVQIADMLPLIQKAGAALLNGENPYQLYYFPYPMPLTFMPGFWLPYVPASVLDIDPRWVGLCLWVGITIILIGYTIKTAVRKSSPTLLLLSSINILLLQFSMEFVSFQAYGHSFAYWLWLIFLGISLAEKKYYLSAVALGLVLCSRQTSIIYFPVAAIFWYTNMGLRQTLKYILVSSFVFCLVMLPFFIMSPYQLIIAPINHYAQLAANELRLGSNSLMSNTIGFAYLIQSHWGPKILSIASGISLFVIVVFSGYMVRNKVRMLVFLAAAATFFSFFTPIPWIYLYYPPLLFLSIAVLE